MHDTAVAAQRSRGKRTALVFSALGLAVLAGGSYTLSGPAIEWWVIRFRLHSADEGERIAAIEWLGDRRSAMAARELLEIAGDPARQAPFTVHLRPMSEAEHAMEALRRIPLGEAWWLSQIDGAGEDARDAIALRLGEIGSPKAIPKLEDLCADADPVRSHAALAIARILPALRLLSASNGGADSSATLRMTNHAPSPLGYMLLSLGGSPFFILERLRNGAWTEMPSTQGGGDFEPCVLPAGGCVDFKVPVPPGNLPLRAKVPLFLHRTLACGESVWISSDEIISGEPE